MPVPQEPPANFLQILETVWWRLDRALDESSLRAAARLYVAEALVYGTTTLVDHHESPDFIEGSLDILADACEELGMRALLCYGATERNHGREEARRGLAECRRFVTSTSHRLVRGLIGIHASFTVSDETLLEAGKLCRELDSVVHVHLAEDIADVEDARQRGYAGPFERLLKNDAMPAGSILAHGVHSSREQINKAAESNLWLVQNPRSNQGNRVGYPANLSASSRVALGTDGYPANMPAENETLLELSRGRGDTNEAEAATHRLDAGRELAAERFGDLSDWIVAGNKRLRHVIVDGRLVVRDGNLLTGDIEKIRTEARQEAELLWKRMKEH
jgi:cytosine/adenosine deaminase-related metal-dependent hydrolase